MSISFGFSRGELIVRKVRLAHAAVPVRADMALDTGARMTVIAPRIAQELGLEPDEVEPAIEVVSATGIEPAVLLRVRSVSLLGAEIRDLRVVSHPLPVDLGLDGILGLNFLKHFKIVIDNETETVTMTKWRE